jgi:hypothetical protein
LLSTAFSTLLGSLVGSSHCGVKRGEFSHHAFIGILFIGVYGLSMLAKIVETRELLAAMTSERTFAGVFPEGGKGVSQGRRDGAEEGQGTLT